MRQPTEKDIEAAKAYLRQRLDAERSMSANLEIIMREAATKIVEICYSANINPQTFRYSDLPLRAQQDIDAVIEWLRDTIRIILKLLQSLTMRKTETQSYL